MPAGTDPDRLLKAAREFARIELAGHRYVMALHRHQASPHVHLCVKEQSTSGKRLHPGKADLHRWRATFAERLRAWGIDAEATCPVIRGEIQAGGPMWRLKARDAGRLRDAINPTKDSLGHRHSCIEAITCWTEIAKALRASDRADDHQLAPYVTDFLVRTLFFAETLRRHLEAMPEMKRYLAAHPQREPLRQPTVTTARSDPEWTR